jgi:preprotein translocase SecF subunit
VLFHFVERKWWYFLFSALLIVPGVFFLAIGGLRPGIEFKGGTLLELSFDTRPDDAALKSFFTSHGHDEATIQGVAGGVEVRTTEMKPEELSKTEQDLKQTFGPAARVTNSSVVSPSFSAELIQNAVKSIALASLLIVLLIAWAFRNFGWAAFRYGIAAIIALLHDAAVVLGIFAILGYFLKVEVDSLFVTAVLTVIGFSVHDTIVVYDRIRENLKNRQRGETFVDIANRSITQTFDRSINTSLTVVLVLTALLLFGGSVIKLFNVALLIGIIIGTYSSIFVASPLVVIWELMTGAKASAGKRGTGGDVRFQTQAPARPRPVPAGTPAGRTGGRPADRPTGSRTNGGATANEDDGAEAVSAGDGARGGARGGTIKSKRKRRM